MMAQDDKIVANYMIPRVGSHLPENYKFYDYYLVRGYAIVQTAGPGSYGSEGLVCTGTSMEHTAFAGVIEWICGNRSAFADKEGTILVSASDWASGDVGMIGHSYSGSIAYEVATTGVDGLKTIIPEAGPASWYGYVNSQGICTGKSQSYDYMNLIAATCTSRLAADYGTDSTFDNTLRHCKQYRSFVRNQQAQLKGDFGKFWEAREWSTQQDGINASALIVTGLNDDNVTTKHADYMREAFLASGNNAKVILHQNAHGLPFDCDEATTLGMGEHTYAEWVNLWLAHELCNMSNDVDSMADFLVQSNVDGLFYESDTWNDGSVVTLRPNGGRRVRGGRVWAVHEDRRGVHAQGHDGWRSAHGCLVGRPDAGERHGCHRVRTGAARGGAWGDAFGKYVAGDGGRSGELCRSFARPRLEGRRQGRSTSGEDCA